MNKGLQILVLFKKGQRLSVWVFFGLFVCFSIFHNPNPYVCITLIFHRNYFKLRILGGLSFRVKVFSETSVSLYANSILVMQVTQF